ncbi:MAG: hypothetical protein KDE51_17925, partial [Anaerolineales bacterium]|nr:hypothetical protein [Anaerolineales bacterium]
HDYLPVTINRHIEIYKLIFEHGIKTLIAPVFGDDILERGSEYDKVAIHGLRQLLENPLFREFYASHQVRVRFYGEYQQAFRGTEYEVLIPLFEQLSAETAAYTEHRLFFGLFAGNAADSIARLSVEHYLATNEVPQSAKLIELYYGEAIERADFFIGFDKFAAFDMPLLADGYEDLYFTVRPSLYLTAVQLRTILYDHLYARPIEPDYATMTAEDWAFMKQFYETHQHHTFGVGFVEPNSQVWYPKMN